MSRSSDQWMLIAPGAGGFRPLVGALPMLPPGPELRGDGAPPVAPYGHWRSPAAAPHLLDADLASPQSRLEPIVAGEETRVPGKRRLRLRIRSRRR